MQKSWNLCWSIIRKCRLKFVKIMNPGGRVGCNRRSNFYIEMYREKFSGIPFSQKSWNLCESFKLWFPAEVCTTRHKYIETTKGAWYSTLKYVNKSQKIYFLILSKIYILYLIVKIFEYDTIMLILSEFWLLLLRWGLFC